MDEKKPISVFTITEDDKSKTRWKLKLFEELLTISSEEKKAHIEIQQGEINDKIGFLGGVLLPVRLTLIQIFNGATSSYWIIFVLLLIPLVIGGVKIYLSLNPKNFLKFQSD